MRLVKATVVALGTVGILAMAGPADAMAPWATTLPVDN